VLPLQELMKTLILRDYADALEVAAIETTLISMPSLLMKDKI